MRSTTFVECLHACLQLLCRMTARLSCISGFKVLQGKTASSLCHQAAWWVHISSSPSGTSSFVINVLSSRSWDLCKTQFLVRSPTRLGIKLQILWQKLGKFGSSSFKTLFTTLLGRPILRLVQKILCQSKRITFIPLEDSVLQLSVKAVQQVTSFDQVSLRYDATPAWDPHILVRLA